MRFTRLPSLSPRRLAWLLALVLLLPLAQTAASWHLLSHARTESSKPASDDYGAHEGHCTLCLTAAALTAGGALPVQSLAPPPIALPAEARQISSTPVRFSRPLRPYESRAPPFVPR